MSILRLETVERGSAVVVVVDGEVDVASAPELQEHVLRLVESRARPVVIDLAQVAFLDSTGVNSLVSLLRALGSRESSLALAAPQPGVARVFDLTGLSTVLAVRDTVEDALATLPQAPPGP